MRRPFILGIISLIIALLITGCSRDGRNVAAVPTPDVPALQLRTLETLRTTIDEHYIYEELSGAEWESLYDEYYSQVEAGIDATEFSDGLTDILSALPAPAVRQTREERVAQATGASVSYGGIGAFVALVETPEPHIVLLSVMPDSPAEAAGLAAHDSIHSIDGEPIAGGDVSLSIARMRGEPGSDVTLVASSPGSAEREVTLTRGEIQSNPAPVEVQTIGPDNSIAYVLFPPAPYANMLNGIFAQIETLSAEQELTGLVLDLRIVNHDDTWPFTDMLSAFGTGALGEVYTREETTPLEIEGEDIVNSQTLPMVILVGSDTRGVLEIFVAALQANGRAQVIGQQTPGNLEGVTAYFLPDGSRLFLPTSSYRTIHGDETGIDGVVPDVVVEEGWDTVTNDNDPVLDAAIDSLLAASEPAG